MGLRRMVKDGELSINEVDTIITEKWKPHERNNRFNQWLIRRKRRMIKSKKK